MKPGASSEPNSVKLDEGTGLPGLKRWRSVYLVVVGSFILWVVLLTALARLFP